MCQRSISVHTYDVASFNVLEYNHPSVITAPKAKLNDDHNTVQSSHHGRSLSCAVNTHTELSSRQDCSVIMKRHRHNQWRCAVITHADRRWSWSIIQARLFSDHEKALLQPMEVCCYHQHRQLMELTEDGADISSRQHCWVIMKRHRHNPWSCAAAAVEWGLLRWWSRPAARPSSRHTWPWTWSGASAAASAAGWTQQPAKTELVSLLISYSATGFSHPVKVHRVTSGQSNAVISKSIFQNSSRMWTLSEVKFTINPHTNLKQSTYIHKHQTQIFYQLVPSVLPLL